MSVRMRAFGMRPPLAARARTNQANRFGRKIESKTTKTQKNYSFNVSKNKKLVKHFSLHAARGGHPFI